MKVRGIDKLIVILEKKADTVGVDIDTIGVYVEICTIITAMNFGEIPTFEEKRWVFEQLRELYRQVGLDFEQAVRELVLEAWGA